MALSAEHILTLQQLKGVGTKTIFKVAEQVINPISTIEELCAFWNTLKGKKLEAIGANNIIEANNSAKRIIAASANASIGLVGYYDESFPDILRHTINEDGKEDPPLLLWYRGDLSVTNLPGLAVIGTREATPEGIAGGTFLSEEFAKRGFNIVSGLAVGCDTCGHKGALNVGGKTTAFLANGLDHDSIYPEENQELAEEIVAKGGLLLSEYPIGQSVNRYALVARDRLQAALSLATLVVQTGVKGGTMHAADTTLKAKKALYTMKFKNEETNLHEKCLGNAFLVKQGAKYISGGDNLDQISESIRNWKPLPTSIQLTLL